MNTEQLKHRLEEEKARLEKEMGSVGVKNNAVPDDYEPVPTEKGIEADSGDQAEVIISHDENAGILADLEARYDSVLAALTRIGKGTYGKCSVCGEAIETARLEANPAATTCKVHMN